MDNEPLEHSHQEIDFRPMPRKARKPGAGVTRHTAAKWYEMMREMLGRAV